MPDIFLPDEVKEAIRKHIANEVAKAIASYRSAREEEDALTGHLGGRLATGPHLISIENPEIGGTWSWSITYYKFRGRGIGATESVLGSDGIFELSVSSPDEVGLVRTQQKSLLFQAKIDLSSDPKLVKQCLRLSTWREAAFVLNFRSDEYEAFSIDSILLSKGKRKASDGKPLAAFLGTDFLECHVGRTGVYYDSDRARLVWLDSTDATVAVQFSVKHRVQISVTSPMHNVLVIPPSDVYKHRLKASAIDILGAATSAGLTNLSKARKRLTSVYHPDRYNSLDEEFRLIAELRMLEVNKAYDNEVTIFRPRKK